MSMEIYSWPFGIVTFPKSGRALRQHSAPVSAHEVQGFSSVPRLAHCEDHIVVVIRSCGFIPSARTGLQNFVVNHFGLFGGGDTGIDRHCVLLAAVAVQTARIG